jgi:transposase
MKYVGADLHKKIISLCVMVLVLGKRTVVARRNFACADTEAIREFFAGLGEFQVVVEATASYEWFLRLVEPMADRLVLAHPKKLRVIAESTRKSDKLDAQVLAEFLALDMIPEAYRPTPRQREHRTLVRYRHYVQQRITGVKNKLRHKLADYNADLKRLFNSAGRKYLTKFAVSSADRFVIDQLREDLEHQEKQLGITKEGSRLLRWALVQTAWRLVGKTRRWGSIYQKLKARCGAKKAIVAVARRVLCVMVAMLRSGQPYQMVAETT